MSKKNIKITYCGQAGFIFEKSDGYRIGVDLYLSDCCYRYFGFKRLMPYMYNPLDLQLDLLIATHAHFDHFDPDSVPLLLSNNKTQLLCANDVKAEAERLGLETEKITYLGEGDVFENESVSVKAMPCDHGPDTPDAIGLLIKIEDKKIYVVGDSSFREDYFTSEELKDVDVLILPINGAFGNMNEIEGAKAAGIIKPKLTVPCHYWNFAEHGGNPNIFAQEMNESYKELKYTLMRPNETILL